MSPPSHPVVAAILDPVMASLDEVRARLIPPIAGEVLELGAGTGQNFRHYAAARTVTAIEPDPHMRRRAERRLDEARVPIVLTPHGAEALPFDDDRFDAIVATWVLCTIPDPATAVAEMARVLRPGGTLWFAEHVRASGSVARRLQHALNPLWRRCAGGCNLQRDTLTLLRDSGWVLSNVEPVGRETWTLTPMYTGRAMRVGVSR